MSKKTYTGIAFSLQGVLIVYFTLYNSFSFNTYYNDYSELIVYLFIPSLLEAFYLMYNKVELFFLQIGYFIIKIVALALYTYSSNYSYSNDHFLVFIVVITNLLSFLLWCDRTLSIRYLFIYISILSFGELLIGINQLWKKEIEGLIYTELKGSFGHIGVYSYFMVIVLPFVWYTLFKLLPDLNTKFESIIHNGTKLLFTIWCMLVVFICISNQNRTGCLLLIVLGIGYVIKSSLIRKVAWPSIIWGLSLVLLVGLYKFINYLILLKPFSSHSRKLFFEIVWNNASQHILTGTGFGRFTWYYPQWQANYFQNQKEIPLENAFSSGETYLMFNEYIQLALEGGIVIFLVYNIAHFCIFIYRSDKHSDLFNTLKVTMLLIGLSGIINYSLHVNIIINIFFICVFLSIKIILSEKNIRWKKTRPIVLIYAYTIMILILFIPQIKYIYRVLEWRQLKTMGYTLPYKSIKYKYDKLYLSLSENVCFLYDYGQLLLRDTTYTKDAIDVLERLKQKKITKASIECLANAYKSNKQYDKAIEEFKWLTNFLPNRFTPKAELLSIYIETGKTVEAKILAQNIIKMPIKIPSSEVDFIRNYAKEFLTK